MINIASLTNLSDDEIIRFVDSQDLQTWGKANLAVLINELLRRLSDAEDARVRRK